MNNKLIDFVMTQMCDEYCRFPYEDIGEEGLELKCSICPLRLFLELLDNK